VTRMAVDRMAAERAAILERSHSAEPGVVYAATNRGVFRSPDAGGTWQGLEVEWPARFERQHVQGVALIA
jgi:hypothetical protein